MTLINKMNSVLLCSLVTSTAFAGFGIQDPQEETYFGCAQNETFRRAIEGEEPLDAVDRAFLANVEESRIGNRWRLKALLSRSPLKLSGVSAVWATSSASSRTSTAPSASQDSFQLFLGWGYKWTRWATDLEVFSGENLDYAISSTTTTTPVTFLNPSSSTIRYLGLFWNVEYELPKFFDFIPNTVHPYIQGGIGGAIKSTNNQFSIVPATSRSLSHDNTTFAWNAGVGIKFEITGKLLGDIAYRVVDLGKVEFGDLASTTTPSFTMLSITADKLKSQGLYFGITYQL